MDKGDKANTISKFELRKGDSGSPEVQVALLTGRISSLTGHMTANRHDHSSQRSLLRLIGRRRRLLTYLSTQDVARYHKLITSLGLRK